MKWLLRPSSLIVLLGLAVLGTAVWIYLGTLPPRRPTAVPVGKGEHEIAWLYPATSSPSWRRFVQAFEDIKGATPDKQTFPDQTTVVPELRVRLSGQRGALLFRWYKLTGELTTDHWVKELMKRSPPPLAIIGGANSDSAKRLAMKLNQHSRPVPEENRPLLLLTTATADTVAAENGSALVAAERSQLIQLYKNKTFRFSFTNRQMCRAVLDFIWKHPSLRPDAPPAYTPFWEDDPYSLDLLHRFAEQYQERNAQSRAPAAAGLASLVVSAPTTGAFPLSGLSVIESKVLNDFSTIASFAIPWSEGAYDRPNLYEAAAATVVLDEHDKRPWQARPLLFLPAGVKPSRRFLRAMYRLSPIQSRKFVVATGDAITLNAIYRDRNISWHIQDMPSSLVFFAHHNPIDPSVGFGKAMSSPGASSSRPRRPVERELGGTNDLLLYRTIARSLYRVLNQDHSGIQNAKQLGEQFSQLKWLKSEGVTLKPSGKPLFTPIGNRQSGTGEHIIWLEPHFRSNRVLPTATIRVFSKDRQEKWVPYDNPLLKNVAYTGAPQPEHATPGETGS